jgi:hypothetical protein
MSQQNPAVYAQAIQAHLSGIVSPVPVYANFNRNFAVETKFLTWQLRDIHQPVYTGVNQNNKGIDTPVFQISIFTQNMSDCFNLSNDILQSLHGYNGVFGGLFYISKADVYWLYNTYDDELNLQQIILDCTLHIPT